MSRKNRKQREHKQKRKAEKRERQTHAAPLVGEIYIVGQVGRASRVAWRRAGERKAIAFEPIHGHLSQRD